MELSANELSIYDKLSETIDLVRQTGHQCGMSEKAIEKFIKQLLERNEPQRGPPRYPVLVALYKVRGRIDHWKVGSSCFAPEPFLSRCIFSLSFPEFCKKLQSGAFFLHPMSWFENRRQLSEV